MAYIKQFNTVGVSRQQVEDKKVLKIRMANDIEWRTFMLTKEGHTDILLVDLGETMSKPEAVKRALALPEFADHAEAQACFVRYLQAEGLIEKVKKPRGRPAKVQAVALAEAPTEALVEAVAETLVETADAELV